MKFIFNKILILIIYKIKIIISKNGKPPIPNNYKKQRSRAIR